MASDYAIEVNDLHKNFGKLKVLEGINLRVKRGTIMALLGPNGAGKTTTVRILATLLQPDSGIAKVHGYDVVEDADDVRAVIGLTGQYAAIDEYLTGRENLQMMGRLYHLSKVDTQKRTEELLKQFDLVDAADRATKTYSGGMRRRLDLAASLIATPPIIFLDEPTTGLDPRSRLAMWAIIKDLVKAGVTILLTTQYLEEADQLADQIAVIDDGKVIAEGTANELKSRTGNERIEFILKKASDLTKAEQAIDGESVKVDKERRSISVANEGGVKQLRIVLDRLDKAGIGIESLSLHKPTLDDVFLELTGHQLASNDETDKKGDQ